MISELKKTIYYFKRNGIVNTYYAARERLEQKRAEKYVYVAPDETNLAKQRKETDGFAGRPLITVVIPTFNPPERYFRKAIESVAAQSYGNWQLYVGDASDPDHTEAKKIMEQFASDDRIEYFKIEKNTGISGNTNAILDRIFRSDKPEPDYIALLDHDDELTPDAFYHMATATRICRSLPGDIDVEQCKKNSRDDAAGMNDETTSAPAVLYSDEDKIYEDETTGEITYFDHHDKYDFNYDLLLTNNYICHLMLIRADILRQIRFRSEYDGAQDYDLVLQIIRRLSDRDIVHIPRVLYHWRSHPGSTATNSGSKMYAYDAGLRALQDHLNSMYGQDKALAVHSRHLGFYRVEWGINNKNDSYSKRIFEVRQDIGAVIGKVIDRNGQMAECIYDACGKPLYAGLNRHYSGAFNRFDCMQEVYAADIGYLTVRPELQKLLDDDEVGNPDSGLHEGASEADIRFAERLHELGYVILYIPAENIN